MEWEFHNICRRFITWNSFRYSSWDAIYCCMAPKNFYSIVWWFGYRLACQRLWLRHGVLYSKYSMVESLLCSWCIKSGPKNNDWQTMEGSSKRYQSSISQLHKKLNGCGVKVCILSCFAVSHLAIPWLYISLK